MPYGNLNVDTVTTSTQGGILGAGNASIMKNRIINGAMVIDQRNAGASVTINSNQYTVDRWRAVQSQTGKYSVQQNAGSVTPPAGYTNYLGVTSLSAYSINATDGFAILQRIEGFNSADLGFGTANAKTVTLSFWVQSSLTGTFGGGLQNSAANRSYPFSYTISSANTWTQISITIPGDTTGTWVGATNGVGLLVQFGLGVGSTYSGTAGSWAGTEYDSATGAVSVVGTNGATWYITGVQLEVGSSATGYEYRQYGTEFILCQRYFWRLQHTADAASNRYGMVYLASTTAYSILLYPNQIMRAIPTGTYSSAADWSLASNNAVQNFSDMTLAGGANGITELSGNLASASVAGQSGELRARTTSAWVALSAEL
jgi:hypothetical protein